MAQPDGQDYVSANGRPNVDTSSIIQALDINHNPSSDNEQRLQALQHLEQVKQRDDIIQVGFALGDNPGRPPLVRHFGLSLLEHVIRHKWHQLSEQDSAQLRTLILNLSQTLDNTPQAFIRNKIASLWIELAKRSWALDWYDLDDYLVRLWSNNQICQEFALSVLENLSDDVYVREDSTAVLRGKDLNTAILEIFSSPTNFEGGIKEGNETHHVRSGQEGWLIRITALLDESLSSGSIDSSSKSVALAALATLRSAFTWIMTPAIVNASCLQVVCMCLLRRDSSITLAASDALLALYARSKLEEIEVHALVYPLCQPEHVGILEQVYSSSVVGIDDIDSPKYTISKRISELLSHLADWITHYEPLPDVDFTAFLQFLVTVARHDSLIVSIPAVHAWDKIMQSPRWRRTAAVQSCIQPVLDFATLRIISYDQIPEEMNEPAVMFVSEEIELHPERQGFYINYRRFCISLVEWVTYTFLDQALDYLLSQVDQNLNDIISAESNFDPNNHTRSSIALLRADAQFTVVDAAFKGITRWQGGHRDTQHEEQAKALGARMKEWSTNMLSARAFKDPAIKQRQIKHAVETSNKVLTADTGFAFTVLEHILASFLPLRPEHTQYSESVSELHAYASHELRRLALEHATYFVTFYDQLESQFSDLTVSSSVDEKVQADLKSTLFLVVQRSQGVDADLRKARLASFLAPIGEQWNQNQNLLASFETFAQSQAFDQIGPYLASIGAANQSDWSNVTFTEDGARIQKTMSSGSSQLPLRETRILLSVSTDRLEQDSVLHKMICELWVPMLPAILPAVLRLVNYNHRLYDPSTWPNVSPEMRGTIKRTLRDRYWQSGISEGSMHDFHRKVKSTKTSLEGFASSVRGRIRNNLEYCYSVIHTLGKLGSHFYSLEGIPEMLSSELLETASPLGLHHFSTLLSMLPKLIEECPPEDRQRFLTPVLATLLRQMDAKCAAEWEKLDHRKSDSTQDDNLNEEMREESVLRQMTYRAVNMVAFWLDPQRETQLKTATRIVNGSQFQELSAQPTMRDFILSNITILEPLLVFCTHSISFRDSRACATMVTALQRLVPVFASETHLQGSDASAVREFVSSEMLKTLITSLHDGYFADYQTQIATLIAMIWAAYGLPTRLAATETHPAYERPAWTTTPRNVLLSLPGMTEERVDNAAHQIYKEGGTSGKQRKLRAIVLQLLEGVRGVRVSELGKIDNKQVQSRILEKYKQREQAGMMGVEDDNGGRGRGGGDDSGGVDLGGLADMFGS